jgi:hypothetical protein
MMSNELSLAEMLADLERRVAFHRSQEEVHARKVAFHQGEQGRHAAALEQAAQQLAALQTAASSAAALLREAAPLPAPAVEREAGPDEPRKLSKLVALVVQEWPADQSFGASDVAAEVERRFAGRISKPIAASTVSTYLRRLSKARQIRTLRPGVSYSETLYETIRR